ncbi:MAG: glycosyltransferase family 2 protein [Actinomycetota bacterium]|nr:glycosyltransferase family 2 protein [Actinomycetota bacterium]
MRVPNADTWVVVPVYNEETVVADVIAEIGETFDHVVCVDDGSRDGSAERIAGTAAHLVRHPINLGQGASLQTGIDYALRRGADYLVTFDADGQHSVADAERMVDIVRRDDVDVVLGSRFLETAEDVPALRKLVLRTVAALSPSSRRLRLTDAHNGLRVLTRPVAEDLRISMNGMAHASEIVATLAGGSWRVREVPVTIRYTEYSRAKGQSLFNGVNILFDLTLRGQR